MEHGRTMVKEFNFGGCRHNKYILNEQLNTVKCGICEKELNPIWVLTQFVNAESRYFMNIEALEKTAEKAKKKNRCKCEHCQKMTRIQR